MEMEERDVLILRGNKRYEKWLEIMPICASWSRNGSVLHATTIRAVIAWASGCFIKG